MSEKVMTKEEIDYMLKAEIDGLHAELDRWTDTVNINCAQATNEVKPKVHFFAKMTCTICGHEHYVNRMELCQFENCEMAISARLLNSVLGFVYNGKKVEELKEKLDKTENKALRKNIIDQIKQEENFFHVRYLCGNCGIHFQDEFRKVFDAKIREVGLKYFV